MNDIMVSICTLAYNHEPYIRQCLDGFIMQQCDFRFEVLIHDDASTDGTQAIIKEYEAKYPDVIKPIYQVENQYSKGHRGISAKFNFPRAKGKYIAMCEGDDYWTDPLKLQKQVDFLEKNPDFSFCAHAWLEKEGLDEKLVKPVIVGLDELNEDRVFTKESFTKFWFAKTLTLVYRKDVIDSIPESHYKYLRDTHFVFHAFKMGKCYFINECMGVYRHHPGGMTKKVNTDQSIYLAYIIARELYDVNRDSVSRKFYLLKTLSLIRSRLYSGKIFSLLPENISLALTAASLSFGIIKTKS